MVSFFLVTCQFVSMVSGSARDPRFAEVDGFFHVVKVSGSLKDFKPEKRGL